MMVLEGGTFFAIATRMSSLASKRFPALLMIGTRVEKPVSHKSAFANGTRISKAVLANSGNVLNCAH